MKPKIEEQIPKIAAGSVSVWISQQRVRCGKPNCRCASGQASHRAFYSFRRIDGKLVKRYVRKIEVKALTLAIAAARTERMTQRLTLNASFSQWRKLRDEMRIRETVTSTGVSLDIHE